jgi:lipoprotein-releasing system permease protein
MTRLPFELLLALRYLRPKRTFVSTITLISIIGVMLGVAVLIIVISVMAGFDQELRSRILGFNAHLRIEQRRSPSIPNYRELMPLVSANEHVKGVAPYVMGQMLARTQPEEGNALQFFPFIRGVSPKAEPNVSILLSSIVDGTNDIRGNGILIGQELAVRMSLSVGDSLTIFSVRDFEKGEEIWKKSRDKGEVNEGLLPREFEIRGIFDVGYYEYNVAFVVTSLANAQDLFDINDSAHGLMVMLKDPSEANHVRSELRQILGANYVLTTWQEENSALLDALLVEKNVMFYLLFFIMIVAAFGITSALITFVVQKTREIGILKAIGASSGQIIWIFFSQSLLVGLAGVTAGLGLGLWALAYRNEFLGLLRRITGFQLFPVEIYNFRELPAMIDRGDIMVICGGSLLICLVAGLFPAWNAGRLKPVEALRHE